MRILILNWKDLRNPEVGGAEIITYELATRLVQVGHEVTWFCRAFRGCEPIEEIEGVKIVRRGNAITTYLHAYFYYKALAAKPDLVIDMVNTICWQTPLYVRGKKIVYVNQLAKEVFFYQLPVPIGWIGYLLETLEYRSYKNVPFICYSNSTSQDLIKLGIPRENISAFSLGLDHTRYVPDKKSLTPLFICVGRLARMKRFDLCIKAMPYVLEKHANTKLAIIGDGPEKERLKGLIGRMNLGGNVFLLDRDVWFFERVEGDKKVAWMQQAWALLLPSVKEGWGMVVTEANACRTPSIVSNVTGLRDSVVDGETGLVVSANPTPVELAESMLSLIEDESLRDRLSSNSVAWAQRFRWDRSFTEFVSIALK